MLSGKDITIDKDGIILNGDKHLLASQAEIDVVKGDIDDLGNTIGDITQSGVTGATVAAQLGALDDKIDTTRIKTTAPVPMKLSFSNGEATIALKDINPDAWEIVSVYAWGSVNALSFALSNWSKKEFKVFNLSNTTYTGNFDVVVVYHI